MGDGVTDAIRYCSFLDNVQCLEFPEYCFASYYDFVVDALCDPLGQWYNASYATRPQCKCGYKVQNLPDETTAGYAERCNQTELCLPPCTLVNFDVQVSARAMPNPISVDYPTSYTNDVVYQDSSHVVILPRSLNTLRVQQQPKLKTEDVLGIIGGNLGLFVGFSLLSVLELFEALLLIVIAAVRYCLCPGARPPSEPDDGGGGGGGVHSANASAIEMRPPTTSGATMFANADPTTLTSARH